MITKDTIAYDIKLYMQDAGINPVNEHLCQRLALYVLKQCETSSLAMKKLEELTPGGSEFHNDPERCFCHVRDRLDHNHRHIIDLVKRTRQIENAK